MKLQEIIEYWDYNEYCKIAHLTLELVPDLDGI